MLNRRTFMAGAASLAAATPILKVAADIAIGPDAKLTILSDGNINLPLSMLARDVAPATLKEIVGQSDEFTSVLNITCLRRGKEVVLFDCGAGANFITGSGKLQASLESQGIAAESVTHVVFTHLHPDHFWGALDDFDSPAFPNAKWLVNKAEVDFWADPGIFQRLPEDRHMFAAGAQRVLKGLGDVLEHRAPGQEWLPGVFAFETPGHTPGHTSFELKAGGDTVIVLGDALTHGKISFEHPEWMPAADHDGDQAIKTRKTVLARAADEKLRVIGYHLPGAVGRVERAAGAYRFVPGEA